MLISCGKSRRVVLICTKKLGVELCMHVNKSWQITTRCSVLYGCAPKSQNQKYACLVTYSLTHHANIATCYASAGIYKEGRLSLCVYRSCASVHTYLIAKFAEII